MTRMHVLRCPLVRAVLPLMLLWWPSAAVQGQSTRWPVPPETMHVDLTARNKNRQLSFDDEGMAYEAVVEFLLIRHPKVALEVVLPEPGRLDVRLISPQAQCEVRQAASAQDHGSVEIVSLVPSMSSNQARERARKHVDAIIRQCQQPFIDEAKQMSVAQLAAYLGEHGIQLPKPSKKDQEHTALIAAYVQHKAVPAVVAELRKQCFAIAEAHPKWVGNDASAGWASAGPGTLSSALRDLFQMQLMAEYLTRHGIPYKDSERLIQETGPLVDAVAEITSGQIGTDAARWRRVRDVLGPEGMNLVRKAVSVQLSVRLYPPVDPRDANSKWFLGQRVACRARDVSAIRVEGSLDPAKHDAVDWWILERYDAAEVIFEPARGEGFKIDPLFRTPHGVLLRVRATGHAAVNYWFELRHASNKGRFQVAIYESPHDDQTEFPY